MAEALGRFREVAGTVPSEPGDITLLDSVVHRAEGSALPVQPSGTSGRISTETYGFAVQENSPLAHEPDFDFLNGFFGRFSAQNGVTFRDK